MSSFARLYQRSVQLLSMSGFSRIARGLRSGQPCILTFHGLRADNDPGLLDTSLHTPVSVFRKICRHLARSYNVVHLSQIVRAFEAAKPLPNGSVAITFDDGYASNHDLAYPILREFDLPATIFVTTGFADGTDNLWFIRLERAFASTGCGTAEFARAVQQIKALPQEEVTAEVERIERELGADSARIADNPDTLKPLTWQQIRDMNGSGLVEFGCHTHRHLIVGRCTTETAREEICHSRDRFVQELGVAPRIFAYPNGKPGDHTAETARLLSDAGFIASVTMSPGFVTAGCDRFALPRYGAPTTLAETEATVSGTFETLKQWRTSVRQAAAAWI